VVKTRLPRAESVPRQESLLAALPTELSHSLFAKARPVSLTASQTLFVTGDEGDGCYRVEEGLLKASIAGPAGGERIMAILGPGSVVGELSMIDRGPRSASVTALRDSKLSFIGRSAFEAFGQSRPELYRHVATLLAQRLRDTDNALMTTNFFSVKAHVARALLSLAEAFGRDMGQGRIFVQQKVSQGDLAAMAGIARENVSRILHESYRRILVTEGSGGSGLSLRSDNLDSIAELYTEDDFRQLVVAIEATPTSFGSLGELEDHGERGLVRETSFGAHGAVVHRGERTFDDVRGAEMLPVLGREVVEGEQRVAILDQALDRFVVFNAPGLDEGVEGGKRILLGLGHPDFLQRPLGFRLLALRQFAGPMLIMISRSGSIARRNARSRAVVRTSSVSPPILSSLPGNTAAMAIARSPRCCARGAGQSTTSGSSVSGNVRG